MENFRTFIKVIKLMAYLLMTVIPSRKIRVKYADKIIQLIDGMKGK